MYTDIVTGDADSSLSPNITLFNFYELKCEVVTRVAVSRQMVKSLIYRFEKGNLMISFNCAMLKYIKHIMRVLLFNLSLG